MSKCYQKWSLEVILTVVVTDRQVAGKNASSLNLSEVSKLKLRQKSFNIIFQHIVSVHSPVIKVLDHIDVDENIWVITKDGKLWAISLTQSIQMEQLSTVFNRTAKREGGVGGSICPQGLTLERAVQKF